MFISEKNVVTILTHSWLWCILETTQGKNPVKSRVCGVFYLFYWHIFRGSEAVVFCAIYYKKMVHFWRRKNLEQKGVSFFRHILIWEWVTLNKHRHHAQLSPVFIVQCGVVASVSHSHFSFIFNALRGVNQYSVIPSAVLLPTILVPKNEQNNRENNPKTNFM